MGLSTEGYSLTPRYMYPTAPKMRMSSVITVANTGRRMESSEMFMSVKTEIGKRKSENYSLIGCSLRFTVLYLMLL